MPSPQLIQNPLVPSTLSGSVDTTTPLNAFQIDLRGFQSSAANLSLTGLSGDANLQVYREPAVTGGARTLVGESKNQGKLAESVLLDPNALTSGIYTVEVALDPAATSANYKLNVAVNADADLSNIFWRSAPTAEAASWKMNGTTIAGAALYNQLPGEWQVQGVADLNADGEDDLILRNMSNGYVAYWQFKGGERVSGGYVADTSIPLDWQIAAVKDLDGDQQADLVWYNAKAGQVALWTLRDGKVVNGNLYNVGAGWKPVTAVDLNGDKKADIILQNPLTGEIAFWQMNGTTITNGLAVKPGASWQPQFFGDFDGDGKTDIMLRDSASGAVAIWLMDGINIKYGWSPGVVATDWQVASVGNFDGKANGGNKDLLWRNQKTGDLAIWLFNQTGRGFADAQLVKFNGQNYNSGANWTIAGVGDFNNDGKEDILYRNEQQGGVEILLMDGTNISSKRALDSIPANWKVQGIMQRHLIAEPFDISGRSSTGDFVSASAFDLGLMDGQATYKNSVQPGLADYFKFNVASDSNVTLSVAETGVNLALFPILSNGTLGSAIALSNEMPLSAGSYAVKVSTTLNAAPTYTLNVVGKPKITDVAGASFSVATNSLALNPSPANSANTTGTNQPNVVSATFRVKNNSSTTIKNLEVGFRISRDGRIDTISTIDPKLVLDGSTSTDPTTYTLATPLAAGATSDPITVQLRLPDTDADFWFVDGNYTIGMVVDPNDKLSESDETNNFNVALGVDKASLGITQTETLELTGTKMQLVSGNFAPDQEIVLSFTLKNAGNRAFPNTTSLPLQFYLSADTTLDKNADIALGIRNAGSTDSYLNQYFIDPVGNGTILGAAGTSTDSKTLQLQLKLPSASSSIWASGQTFYLSVWIDPSGNTAKEADVSNNKIDPTNAGIDPAIDTIGKNYLKFIR
ncbi:MAG: hypothetical protein C4288_03635 [Leptolyngbya sp. ERB_1_1]